MKRKRKKNHFQSEKFIKRKWLIFRSEDHVMEEIGKFLTHMEQPRLLYEEAEDGEEYVRTEEEKDELREKILLGVNNARMSLFNFNDRKKRFMECLIEIRGRRIKSRRLLAR